MHKIIIVIFLLVSIKKETIAQNYTIRYGCYNIVDSVLGKKNNKYLLRNDLLFINGDSISFYCHNQGSGKDPGKTIGEKGIHHSVYTFPLIYKHLDVNAWKKPYDLNESDTRIFNWTIMNDTAVIEGLKCRLAVSETKKQRAWFTNEITISSGPSIYNGLPGLIIRLEDYTYHRIFEAEMVRKSAPRIVLTDYPIEPCKHCVVRIEEIKKYFAD